MNIRLTIITFLLVSLFCCHKPKQKKPYYPMDEAFKRTFLQGNEGSYWIYTDSLETFYDTVTLVHCQKGYEITAFDNNYTGEGYDTHYQPSNCLDFFTILQTYRLNQNNTEKTAYSFDMNTQTGSEYSLYLNDGNYINKGSGYIKTIDSVILLKKEYFNVVKLFGGSAYNEIIIEPNIGIIYKKAWSTRPNPGVKTFFLKDYKLY